MAPVPLNVGHMLLNIGSQKPLDVDDVDGHPSEVARRSMAGPRMGPIWPPEGGPKRFFAILVLVEPSERFPEAREHRPELFNDMSLAGPQHVARWHR